MGGCLNTVPSVADRRGERHAYFMDSHTAPGFGGAGLAPFVARQGCPELKQAETRVHLSRDPDQHVAAIASQAIAASRRLRRDKIADKIALRFFANIVGAADLLYPAHRHDDDQIGKLHRLILIVGYEYSG